MQVFSEINRFAKQNGKYKELSVLVSLCLKLQKDQVRTIAGTF